jgi:hypothetical protein
MRTPNALVGLALFVLSLPACGGGDTPRGEATYAPTGSEDTVAATVATDTTPPPDETTTGAATERAYEVWLAEEGFLRLAWRLGPQTEGVGRAALDLLVAERDATALPAGADVRALHVAGDSAHVDLAGEIRPRTAKLALAQVVYTLTQFENVRSVAVTFGGEPAAGHEEPQTRENLADLLAPVIVETPTGLEPVTSPIQVSGTANTFEANVTLRVLGDGGEELASTFTTATCGNGCRGDFEASVAVDVPAETRVTLVVGEEDPSGGEGRPPYAAEIPLVLRP